MIQQYSFLISDNFLLKSMTMNVNVATLWHHYLPVGGPGASGPVGSSHAMSDLLTPMAAGSGVPAVSSTPAQQSNVNKSS